MPHSEHIVPFKIDFLHDFLHDFGWKKLPILGEFHEKNDFKGSLLWGFEIIWIWSSQRDWKG